MGLIRTVLGDVEPEPDAVFLAHEHLAGDLAVLPWDRRQFDSPSHLAAVRMQEIDAWIQPAKDNGVRYIVDATPAGLGREPDLIANVARQTGVGIIGATGLWKRISHPEWTASMDGAQLAGVFIRDLTEGMDGGPYRAGVIKLAGDHPLKPAEEVAFRAGAKAQAATGATIITHTDGPPAGLAQIQLLVAAGADPGRIIISHIDYGNDFGYNRALADAGVWIEIDQIATNLPFSKGVTDNERAAMVVDAVERGYDDHLLFSTDEYAFRIWKQYPAPSVPRPYSTLFDHWRPLLERSGIARSTIDAILTLNPARAFGWVAQ